jgi:hypothetical protein
MTSGTQLGPNTGTRSPEEWGFRLTDSQTCSDLRPLNTVLQIWHTSRTQTETHRTCEKQNEFGFIVSGRPHFLVVDNWERPLAVPMSPFRDCGCGKAWLFVDLFRRDRPNKTLQRTGAGAAQGLGLFSALTFGEFVVHVMHCRQSVENTQYLIFSSLCCQGSQQLLQSIFCSHIRARVLSSLRQLRR